MDISIAKLWDYSTIDLKYKADHADLPAIQYLRFSDL